RRQEGRRIGTTSDAGGVEAIGATSGEVGGVDDRPALHGARIGLVGVELSLLHHATARAVLDDVREEPRGRWSEGQRRRSRDGGPQVRRWRGRAGA
ncbi:hypothetical protein GW17_00047054, partial [Ensete ventricosum]